MGGRSTGYAVTDMELLHKLLNTMVRYENGSDEQYCRVLHHHNQYPVVLVSWCIVY
jgi:hypothetical protein